MKGFTYHLEILIAVVLEKLISLEGCWVRYESIYESTEANHQELSEVLNTLERQGYIREGIDESAEQNVYEMK